MSTQTSYISAGPYHDIISGIQLIFSFSDGVVRLTGPAETGKTRLLDALLDTLQNDQQLAMLFRLPLKSPLELHNHLTRELALPANMGFRKALARFITARPRDKQHLILLFDDADCMDEETLLDLLQLREVTNNGQALVSIVLAGLPSLNEQLALPALADLTREIALSYELEALGLQELETFCAAAITSLDLKIPRPTTRTLNYILSETGGLPGRVLALLPGMVAEPEMAPSLAAVPVDSPAAKPARKPEQGKPARTSVASAGTVGRSPLSRLRLPFDANKLRYGLYGGAALAATVAVTYLLYPQLAPLLQKPATQPVVSIPAPALREPEPAPVETAPPVAVETAPPVATETIAAAPEEAPSLPAPALATLTPPEPVSITPPPASSTVSVLPQLPSATLQELTPEALEEVVRNWISAWQNQDLDAYFGAYHTDFAPLYQGTRADWRDNRNRSITRPSAISIALEDFTVNGESLVGTHVSFWLEYHTATYADRTRKELVIGHDLDGSLRILQEINRQVTTLTPSEFLSGPDTSTIATAPAASSTTGTSAPRTPAAASGSNTRTVLGSPIQLRPGPTVDNTVSLATNSISAELGSELRAFLGSWLEAWQRQDVADYFRHYHPGFYSSAFASRRDWEADRTRKITRPLAIQIHLQNLQVVDATAGQGDVELQMEYHSSYYADRTRKAMRLARTANGSWEIMEERNLRVEALPLARLVPGTSFTLRAGVNTIFERAL